MSEAVQEPKSFSAEFDRLYAEYLGAGAPGSWEQWLRMLPLGAAMTASYVDRYLNWLDSTTPEERLKEHRRLRDLTARTGAPVTRWWLGFRSAQDRAYANKVAKGFNTTDVPMEFGLLVEEVGEAFSAWRKQRPSLGGELADVAIFLLGIAEITGIDLGEEVAAKLAANEAREYLTLPNGTPVKAEVTSRQAALPTFPHKVYGVNLTFIGDEGAIMAEGHVPLVRFVAACNNMTRNESGCRNLLDDSGATLSDALEGVRQCWALPAVDPDGDKCDWHVRHDSAVTAETPGAIPVTLWEP